MSRNNVAVDQKKTVSNGYKCFMVFLCMLTQAIPYGIAQNIQPLFVHPLVNTFHFTLASYTLIFTFGAVAASIASPFIGKALEKVNYKIMYLIGMGLSALAYAIFCGLAVFSYMSGPAFMAKDLFGAKEQGVMLGYVGLAYAIGFAIGAPLFGIIKGMSSFTVAWYFMLAFVIIGFALLIVAVIQIKKYQKKYIAEQAAKGANA